MDRYARSLLSPASLLAAIAAAIVFCGMLGRWVYSSEPRISVSTREREDSVSEPPSRGNDRSPTADSIDQLLSQLDAPRYAVRSEARARLETLLTQPETAGPTVKSCRAALHRTDLSYEVRHQLICWLRQAAEAADNTTEPDSRHDDGTVLSLSHGELQREIAALVSDSFARRQAARFRLSRAYRDPQTCVAALEILSGQLDAKITDPADLGELRSAFEAATAQWLLTSPEVQLTRPIGPDRIERWVSLISTSADANDPLAQLRVQAAIAQVQVAMADDRTMASAIEALRRKLAGPLPPRSHAALVELVELTRPAMVAEYWAGGRHQGEQHLLIGVPSQAPGAARPSHFDRIDDQWAHCVSGNTLSPGLYPTNVAVPHPMSEESFFHLVNLPRPRDRLAYRYRTRQDDAARLKQISRRTVNRMLDPPRPLTEAETIMLAQLDSGEVARFAGEYFARIADGPFPDHLGPLRLGGRPSRLGLVCAVLAEHPDRRAAAGLLRAIDRQRFAPPTSACPYRMEYLAALTIAQRDPWDGVDQWLAAQAGEAIDLVEDQRQDPPELAATAAALLIQRRQADRQGMGLYPVADPVLSALGIEGYRFAHADDRRRFLGWWKSQKVSP